MKLTVYFEGEFWVGVTEHETDGKVKASRHVFGSEPYDAEVMEFVQFRMLPLLAQTSVGVSVDAVARRGRVNPKRLAREAAREMERKGIRSAAQEALKLDLEHRKKTRQIVSREQREAEKERKREIAIQKAKAKHRGR